MKRKRALITLKLVDESLLEQDTKITQELMEWFKNPAAPVPWIQTIESVRIRDC